MNPTPGPTTGPGVVSAPGPAQLRRKLTPLPIKLFGALGISFDPAKLEEVFVIRFRHAKPGRNYTSLSLHLDFLDFTSR